MHGRLTPVIVNRRSRAVILVAAMLATCARGQPLTGHMDSIEWLVADSDLVVTGRITSLQQIARDDDSASGWFLATVKTDATLKGVGMADVRFVVRSIDRAGRVREFAKDRRRLMVFLRESRHLASKGTVFRPSTSKEEWRFARE